MKNTLRRAVPVTAVLLGLTASLLTGTTASSTPAPTLTVRSDVGFPSVRSYPTGVVIDPSTEKAYIPDLVTNTVSVFNTVTDSFEGPPIPVGYGPVAVAFNPNTKKIAVAEKDDGTVSVIDVTTQKVIDTITVPLKPEALKYNQNTNELWVASTTKNLISVINMNTGLITATIDVVSPTAIEVDYVTNRIFVLGQNDLKTNYLAYFIDGATRRILKKVGLPNRPSDLAVDPVTHRLYICSFSLSPGKSGGVDILDGDGVFVTGTIPVPAREASEGHNPGILYNIAVDPRSHKVFALARSGGVWTLDALTYAFETNPSFAPQVATGVAVNPLTGEVLAPYVYSGPGNPGVIVYEQRIKPTVNARITSDYLPEGSVGSPYIFSVTAAANPSTVTFSDSGTLPPGLTINSTTGVISGTPTLAGDFRTTIAVTNGVGALSSVSYALKIVAAASRVPKITSPAPPPGTVFVPYSFFVTATGPGLSYQISSGKLPSGLSLNPTTGEISGTPSPFAAGIIPKKFTVSVSNVYGTASETYRIPISTTAP